MSYQPPQAQAPQGQGQYRPTPQQIALAQAQAQAQAQGGYRQASTGPGAGGTGAAAAAYQQQQRAAQSQGQGQGQTVMPNEHVSTGDGNDGFRGAKRRKPTDRSLPTFLPTPFSSTLSGPTVTRLAESSIALVAMSESYKKLQAVERKLDWNVSRKRVELDEVLKGGRIKGVKKIMRLHVTTKLIDQPWQQSTTSTFIPPPLPSTSSTIPPLIGSEPEVKSDAGDMSVDEIKVVGAEPDFKEGTGIPRFEVSVSAEILNDEGEVKKKFSDLIKGLVIDTNRDPMLYTRTGSVEWRRPETPPPPAPAPAPSPPLAGVTLTLPTSTPTTIHLSLFLDQQPEVFSIAPDLATMLNLHEGERVEVLESLWSYIRANGLVSDDGRGIVCDERMVKIFSAQAKVPFHHLPEYANRFLAPPLPIQLEVNLAVDEAAGEIVHSAFDVPFGLEGSSRGEMKKIFEGLSNMSDERIKELIALDEKMAKSSLLTKSVSSKRSSLIAFATSPQSYLSNFLSSQASDLSLILGSERGTSSLKIGGGADWREEIRRSQVWNGEWVEEAVGVAEMRRVEVGVRSAQARAQAQMQQMQMQQMGVNGTGAGGGGGQQLNPQQLMLMQQQQQQQQSMGRR